MDVLALTSLYLLLGVGSSDAKDLGSAMLSSVTQLILLLCLWLGLT